MEGAQALGETQVTTNLLLRSIDVKGGTHIR